MITSRFLVTSQAMTTIQKTEAHHDISFACATILMSGFDLLRPGLTEGDCLMHVASGLYGLVPYASEYWVEHLLTYASCVGTLDQSHPLMLHFSQVREKHDQISTMFQNGENGTAYLGGYRSQDQMDKRLGLLVHPPVHQLVHDILRIRWMSNQEACESGKGECPCFLDAHKFRYSASYGTFQ